MHNLPNAETVGTYYIKDSRNLHSLFGGLVETKYRALYLLVNVLSLRYLPSFLFVFLKRSHSAKSSLRLII